MPAPLQGCDPACRGSMRTAQHRRATIEDNCTGTGVSNCRKLRLRARMSERRPHPRRQAAIPVSPRSFDRSQQHTMRDSIKSLYFSNICRKLRKSCVFINICRSAEAPFFDRLFSSTSVEIPAFLGPRFFAPVGSLLTGLFSITTFRMRERAEGLSGIVFCNLCRNPSAFNLRGHVGTRHYGGRG